MIENQASVGIKFEQTPNPATLKFVLSVQILEEGFDCPTAQDAERSPLAAKIFGFPWTSSVFIGPNYISVTKQDWVDWEILAEPLANIIKEHIDSGRPVEIIHSKELHETDNDENPNDSLIVQQIKSILNREIRPMANIDGGDILFGKYEDDTLFLKMKGACSGCPSSQVTLKGVVEVRMKELLPQIKEVIAY